MTEWRPIETAPRDGTPVLVGINDAGTRVVLVRWQMDDWRYPFTIRRLKAYTPTHWMPLPAPPKSQ